jgi:hypothetical protein
MVRGNRTEVCIRYPDKFKGFKKVNTVAESWSLMEVQAGIQTWREIELL